VQVAFEVCADESCATVLARGYVADETAQWQPPALPEGTYFWRAFAIDGAALESGWSALHAFAIDTTPPAVPTLAAGVDRPVNKAELAATSADGDATAIAFQLCADADCAVVLSSANVFGAGAHWSTALVDDGTYYWRAAATDAAGNVSAWSSTQQLTADVTPPAQPRAFDGNLNAKLLSLRWKAPKEAIRGYVVYVNGKRWRTLRADTLGIDVRVRAGDRRTFAVAAIDTTGNIGQPTRSVVLVPQLMRMTLAQAQKAAATQGLLLRYSTRAKKTPQRIVEQSPAAETLVATGTVVTVVVDGLARSAR
jgi:hypothetical protein